ncbi:MAG: response regulator [Thermodesulfobacteriota bacterium]
MSKETIVILDKERHVQWTLKNLLEGEDYTILSSDSIGSVMPTFLEREVACLITEYWVDHLCTLELVRGLKKRFPETYVMMVTSEEVDLKKYEEIMSAGVDDFFEKPFSAEKILLHLRKGLRQRNTLLQKRELEQELKRIHLRRGRESAGISSRGKSLHL